MTIFVMCQAVIKPGLSNVLPEGILINLLTWLSSAALSLYLTREIIRHRNKKHPVSDE